jgi:hypothetical protein
MLSHQTMVFSQGFVAQTMKMDPIEKARRWKRSLDGYITFRKAVLLALFGFAFILYVGPSIFSWLFQSKTTRLFGKKLQPVSPI